MNFRLRGYRVLTAADGDEGLRAAFDERPDLIVLDLMLPGTDGLEILAELRGRDVGVPVLILSARDRLQDKVRGLEIGASGFGISAFGARPEPIIATARSSTKPVNILRTSHRPAGSNLPGRSWAPVAHRAAHRHNPRPDHQRQVQDPLAGSD